MPQRSTLPPLPDLGIEAMEFMYRPNFSGAKERYNAEGDRYFNAKIPDNQMAEQLDRDGWNIKWSKPGANHPNPSEHIPEPYIEVKVGFAFRPPTIILIKRNRDGVDKPTIISERTVALLDSTEFENIDVVLRARPYRLDSEVEGYSCYLKEFYGRVQISDIGAKYAYLTEVPDEPVDTSDQEDGQRF